MILRRGYQFTPGYRLQAYVGKGQFGEVWRASGPGGVTLAVKFIDLTDGSGQKEYAAIKRIKSIRQANLMQITAIWQLDEEGNVLPEPPDDAEQTMDLFDLDSQSESGFVVNLGPEPATLVVGMLLGDASLEKFLPRKGDKNANSGVPPGDLLRYMEGVARGLDFLNAPKHDFGAGPVALQHCDIKPANIVLIGDSAVICDFGLARILQRNQATLTQAAGTPAYMSPEAIDGKPSCHSDQYSLAVTYYHLRTGTLPVKDGSVYQVLQAHRSGKLQFERVPGAEREILRRATQMDWRERFPSNTAFVDAIRVALTEQGLRDIGQGAGPTKKHSPDPSPQRGPDGPAAEGIQTMPTADLTDGIVEHSKGGSPIISDPVISERAEKSSRVRSRPDAERQSKQSDQTMHSPSDAVKPHQGTVDLSPIALDGPIPLDGLPDEKESRASAGTTPRSLHTPVEPSTAKASRKPWIVVASVVVVAFAGLAWWKSGDQSRIAPPDKPDPFAEAVDLLPNDLALAKQQFEAAIKGIPSLKQPVIEFATDKHQGAIEVIAVIGNDPKLLTTGYDKRPRLWSDSPGASPSDETKQPANRPLSSVVLAELPANVYNKEAVRITADQRWLLIGSGASLQAWAVDRLLSADRNTFPIQPSAQWTFDDEVISLAVHPREPTRIVVAIANQTAFVVDIEVAKQRNRQNANQGNDASRIAQTALVDVASLMHFVESGQSVVMRQESGDLVAFDWSALATNDAKVGAVPEIQTGITGVRDVVIQPQPDDLNSNVQGQIWGGDEEGVLSGYVVETVDQKGASQTQQSDKVRFRRWFVDDDVHQRGMTVVKSARIAANPSANGNDWVLVSGDEEGRLGIHRYTASMMKNASVGNEVTTSSQTAPTAVDLQDGPVRCLDISPDGKWLAVGAKNAVWVINLESPLEYLTRLKVADVSVDSVLIDAANDQLVVGCGDGQLARFNWSHCQLRTLVAPIRDDAPDSAEPGPRDQPKRPKGKLTFTHPIPVVPS